MLSNIQKLLIDEFSINLTLGNVSYQVYCDVNRLITDGIVYRAKLIIEENEEETEEEDITVIYKGDFIKTSDEKFQMFFPHEMMRCVVKDLKRGRAFDISYRRHLVFDYSRDHHNLIVPFPVTDKILERGIEITKRYSNGKRDKPTGIILETKVIVVKGDSNFVYDL